MELKENSLIVETQTFRFIPSIPVNQDNVISLAGGSRNGEYAIVVNESPKSTIVIDPSGSIIVHNISRKEVAKLVAQRLLLSIGMSDKGMVTYVGELLIQFSISRAVLLELAADRFLDIDLDSTIGALRINAKRHECRIILFNNGKGVVLGQTSRRVAELAINYWTGQLEKEGALA